MKVLIWIGCSILHCILSSIIKPIVYQIPVTDDRSILLTSTLYGILIAASGTFCIWLAKFLCRKCDLHKVSKKAAKVVTTAPKCSDPILPPKKVEVIAPEATQNEPERIEIVTHNIKPTKKVRSMKPLIIVTYILLIAVIIALTVFCVLSIQNKDNTISLLEADKAALQDDLKSTESKLKAKENELKTIKVNLKNTQNNLTDTNKKLSNTLSSLTDARTDAAMWKEKYMQSDPANVTYSYEFPSVNALLMAIKKNPEAYHNKQVKVFGMILAYEHLALNKKVIALIDYKNEALSNTDDFVVRSLYRTKTEVKEAIEVTLSNDLQYIVAETGDYVNLYGTVRITTGGIFLDKSQYN